MFFFTNRSFFFSSRITYKEVFNFFPKQFATRAIENETLNEDDISGYLK